MEVNCIIKEDGLLTEEGRSTDPEDSILESEDEIQSAQIQRPTDKPKERQKEQSLELPRKRRHNNSRRNEEHQPRKRPRQETAESLSEKIRKSEESISKLRTHSEKGLTQQRPSMCEARHHDSKYPWLCLCIGEEDLQPSSILVLIPHRVML